jgi:hypothetical protein
MRNCPTNNLIIAYGLGIGLSPDSYELFKDEPPKSMSASMEGFWLS